jgi:hypothetical protein
MQKHLTIITDNKDILSHILSKTRLRTSAFVKFCKHILQIARERIIIIPPIIDLRLERWLISGTAIPRRSIGYRGRIIITIVEVTIWFILIVYGRELLQEAKHNISDIIFRHSVPDAISIKTWLLMICTVTGSTAYYFMAKPWDLKQVIKEHTEDCEKN